MESLFPTSRMATSSTGSVEVPFIVAVGGAVAPIAGVGLLILDNGEVLWSSPRGLVVGPLYCDAVAADLGYFSFGKLQTVGVQYPYFIPNDKPRCS